MVITMDTVLRSDLALPVQVTQRDDGSLYFWDGHNQVSLSTNQVAQLLTWMFDPRDHD